MAVSRGGVAFFVNCIYSHGRRQPIKKKNWVPYQTIKWHWSYQRTLSNASWALAPPNSLRYQNIKQPALFHPVHPAIRPNFEGVGPWEESVTLCVLVHQGEYDSLCTLLEIPVCGHSKLGEFLVLGVHRSSEFSFPLTTVDGRREDDISIDAVQRQHGCFRSLFEAESCPAPFIYGSRFYCFHCPGAEPDMSLNSNKEIGHDNNITDVPLLPAISLCSHTEMLKGNCTGDDRGREQKLALMYERLRIELPSFFKKSHDYSMYSHDLEFINDILKTKTRGRLVYQLTLSLWRLLSLCYCADIQLEVLKLTKHMEDGTIKARWRVRCLPFHSLLLRFYQKDRTHLYRSCDAFSTFYIGQDGLIHCHKIEKIMPAQPPILTRVTSVMARALVVLGVQEHRPALNLLPLLLSSLRQMRNYQQQNN